MLNSTCSNRPPTVPPLSQQIVNHHWHPLINVVYETASLLQTLHPHWYTDKTLGLKPALLFPTYRIYYDDNGYIRCNKYDCITGSTFICGARSNCHVICQAAIIMLSARPQKLKSGKIQCFLPASPHRHLHTVYKYKLPKLQQELSSQQLTGYMSR